jgi:hypothetical protein
MKQETLEEAAGKYAGKYALSIRHIRHIGFEDGAKWQAERIGLMEIELKHTKTLLESCEKALEDRDNKIERMYSEEEVIELLTARCKHFGTTMTPFRELLLKQDLEWFEENKKK